MTTIDLNESIAVEMSRGQKIRAVN